MLGKAGPALDDVLVLRVLASSLGIRQLSGQVAFLLPRNATIPTKREASLSAHAVPIQPVNFRTITAPNGLRQALSVDRYLRRSLPSCGIY